MLAIGVDLGGTNLRVALINDDYEVLTKTMESSTENIIDLMVDLIDDIITPEVTGIGIGVAGVIDRKRVLVRRSPNLEAVEGVDFGEVIGKKFSLPLYIENDANAYAIGEKKAGAGRCFSSFVLLTLGTGIGGGVVYKERLLDIAAEFGHVTVEAGGVSCPCGNSGCLEAYASARAMTSMTVESLEAGTESLLKECCNGNIYKITPGDIYNCALEGDGLAREILKTAGRYLGIGIANLINIFSPEAVILGGGLTGAWNIYVEEARREAEKRAFPELFEGVGIIPAESGDDAGVIGSASLVFDNLRNEQV